MERLSAQQAKLFGELVRSQLTRWTHPIALGTPKTPFSKLLFGSAQIFRIGEHDILVTASHNVEHRGERAMIGFAPKDSGRTFQEGGIEWLTGERRIFIVEPTGVFHSEGTGESTDVTMDFAFIQMLPGEVERLGLDVISPFQMTSNLPIVGEMCMLVGYPSQLYAVGSPCTKANPKPFFFASKISNPRHSTFPLEPTVHLAIQYPREGLRRETNQIEKLPSPGGVSGCGIWVFRPDEQGLLSYKSAKMIGVQYAHHEKSNFLVGNNTRMIIAALCTFNDDIRDFFVGNGFDRSRFNMKVIEHSEPFEVKV